MKKFFITILLISFISIISAPSITTNKDNVNDPQAHSVTPTTNLQA